MPQTKTASAAGIERWRSALTALSGDDFCDLMRMYLGEIKTPYNKQTLIDSLVSFLHNQENRQRIRELLGEKDIAIITLIRILNGTHTLQGRGGVTAELLEIFFERAFSFSELRSRLKNLEERLLIFYCDEKHCETGGFFINPLLEQELLPLCTIDRILRAAEGCRNRAIHVVELSPLLLACFLCFVSQEGDIRKADGTIKKRSFAKLESLFPLISDDSCEDTEEFWLLLFKACLTLGLFRIAEDGTLSVNVDMWKSFAQLPEPEQYAYLCAAAHETATVSEIALCARKILFICTNMPESGYTETMMHRFMRLCIMDAAPPPAAHTGSGRFAEILRRHTEQEEDGSDDNKAIWYGYPKGTAEGRELQRTPGLLESMKKLGLIKWNFGRNGRCYYASELFLQKNVPAPSEDSKRLCTLDASGRMTVLPGMQLAELLELLPFLQFTRYDTAALFELTKTSVFRAFDQHLTPEDIERTLAAYSSAPLSQHQQFELRTWQEQYNAAALYKGYVLKVSEESIVRIENSRIAEHIICTIAPGVYLLDVRTDAEAAAVCRGTVFTACKSVLSVSRKTGQRRLQPLYAAGTPQTSFLEKTGAPQRSGTAAAEQESFFAELERCLECLELTDEQRDELQSRIRRKIILTPQQLSAQSVRPEKMQADSMDFLGKLRIIERARDLQCEVELTYDDEVVRGVPIVINKSGFDASVRLTEGGNFWGEFYSVSRAKLVKRLRETIFEAE